MADVSRQTRFEVFETENSGRGLRAVNYLYPGDTVLEASPSLFVLSNSVRGERCDCCFSLKEDLQRCSKCKFARYCGRDCQRKAWKDHKVECERLINVSPRIPTDIVRLIARILEAKSRGDTASWFDSLLSHQNDFDDCRKEAFSSVLFVLQQYVGEKTAEGYSPAEIFEIFGRISCNSFTICDAEMQPLGVGIYHSVSLLNHSCQPNCVAVFNGTKLMIRVTENIQPGEELTISYTELLAPSFKRKEELRKQYFFDCCCIRCSSAKEEDGLLLSMKCFNSSCNGTVLLLQGDGESVCSVCNTKAVDGTLSQMDLILTSTKKALDEIKTLQKTGCSKAALDLCEETLNNQQKVLHHHHYLVVSTLDSAMDSCIGLQLWNKALAYGLKGLEAYEKFYPKYHPSVGIQLFKIGKLQLYLGRLHEGVESLEQARAILEVTHGNKHPLLDQLRERLAEGTEELMGARRGDMGPPSLSLAAEK